MTSVMLPEHFSSVNFHEQPLPGAIRRDLEQPPIGNLARTAISPEPQSPARTCELAAAKQRHDGRGPTRREH